MTCCVNSSSILHTTSSLLLSIFRPRFRKGSSDLLLHIWCSIIIIGFSVIPFPQYFLPQFKLYYVFRNPEDYEHWKRWVSQLINCWKTRQIFDPLRNYKTLLVEDKTHVDYENEINQLLVLTEFLHYKIPKILTFNYKKKRKNK